MDSICKEIDAEDVGAMTLCGLLAAMDSSPPPNATPPMKLRRNFSHNTGLGTKNQVLQDNSSQILKERFHLKFWK